MLLLPSFVPAGIGTVTNVTLVCLCRVGAALLVPIFALGVLHWEETQSTLMQDLMWAGMSGIELATVRTCQPSTIPLSAFSLISFFANRKHNKCEINHLTLITSSAGWLGSRPGSRGGSFIGRKPETPFFPIAILTHTHLGVIEFPVPAGRHWGNWRKPRPEIVGTYKPELNVDLPCCFNLPFSSLLKDPSASFDPSPGCLIRVVGGDWGRDPFEGTLGWHRYTASLSQRFGRWVHGF